MRIVYAGLFQSRHKIRIKYYARIIRHKQRCLAALSFWRDIDLILGYLHLCYLIFFQHLKELAVSDLLRSGFRHGLGHYTHSQKSYQSSYDQDIYGLSVSWISARASVITPVAAIPPVIAIAALIAVTGTSAVAIIIIVVVIYRFV